MTLKRVEVRPNFLRKNSPAIKRKRIKNRGGLFLGSIDSRLSIKTLTVDIEATAIEGTKLRP